MIPLTTDVRLKRGIPRAVTGIILGTLALHTAVEICIQLGWVDPNFRAKWMTFDFANPNPFDWFLALFSHANYWHWFGNMLFLWIFGSILEDRIGWLKFLLLFLFCGATADILYYGLTWLAFHQVGQDIPHIRSLGASGAIAGIMGLSMFRFYKANVYLLNPSHIFLLALRRGIPLWVFCMINLGNDVLGFFTADGVAHLAHIGGFLGGLVAASFLRLKKESDEEIHLERGLLFREARMHQDAAEEFEKVLALNPQNAQAHQEIGFSHWGLHNPMKSADPDLGKARKHFNSALELYLKEGQGPEAVLLYEKLMKVMTPKDFPEKIPMLLKAAQKDSGMEHAVLASDPVERRVLLEENFRGQYHRGSYQAAHETLQELQAVMELQKMEPDLLEAGGEVCLRLKDQAGMDAYYGQLSQRGDERQTVRALTILAKAWLRTPKQLQLNVLYKKAMERLPKVGAYDDFLRLGEQLKT